MSASADRFETVSVDEYLAGEESAEVRHEYVDGRVYAMAGGTVNHAAIQSNALAALHASLRGKPCRPYGSDMKIRVVTPGRPCFFYPDLSVVCDSNPGDQVYQDRPVLILEVLSHSTRRVDDGEKREAYFSIPTLMAYLLAEQDSPAIRVYRRTDTGFAIETYSGNEAVILLPEIDCQLTLSQIYDGVQFVPEPGNPEDITPPKA